MEDFLVDWATKLRSYKAIFKDKDFEGFMYEYALRTMEFEGIPPTAKLGEGYSLFLIRQKCEDLIREIEPHYLEKDKPINISRKLDTKNLNTLIRAEHHFGRTEGSN